MNGVIKTFGELIYKKYITETIIEVGFRLDSSFNFIPGQFAYISVTSPYKRPYSILDYKDGILSFLIEVRDPGKGSDYFRNVAIGTKTEILGGLGKFFVRNTDFIKVFISTGVGVTPFIPMIKSLEQLKGKPKVILFHGMKYLKDDCAWPYLNFLDINDSFRYIRCVTREDESKLEEINLEDSKILNLSGRVTLNVPNIIDDFGQCEFYISGGNQMIKDMRKELIRFGADKIYLENYG